MTTISYHLQSIQERIVQACARAQRSIESVHLLAVSKTFGEQAIQEAIAAGQLAFGENYVAEGVSKIQHFRSAKQPLQWHMIGSIQSNKTKDVAENFQWVHSIDRFKIAQRLSQRRPQGYPPLQVCITVNVSGEISKSGVKPEEVKPLAQQIMALPHIQLRGLMCIPEPAHEPTEQRKPFAILRALLQDLQSSGCPVDTLSMGMSEDMGAAIMEGATIIRIGRGIFGARDYGKEPS